MVWSLAPVGSSLFYSTRGIWYVNIYMYVCMYTFSHTHELYMKPFKVTNWEFTNRVKRHVSVQSSHIFVQYIPPEVGIIMINFHLCLLYVWNYQKYVSAGRLPRTYFTFIYCK